MKLTIDTTSKTVIIEERETLRDLILFLQKHLPDWEEYTLIPFNKYYYQPSFQPSMSPWVGVGTAKNPYEVTYGSLGQAQMEGKSCGCK
jgi:hypothetical protein